MADWADISRNARSHGHFAGCSETEQDAYFEFFAGPDQSWAERVRRTVSIILQKCCALLGLLGIRQTVSGLRPLRFHFKN